MAWPFKRVLFSLWLMVATPVAPIRCYLMSVGTVGHASPNLAKQRAGQQGYRTQRTVQFRLPMAQLDLDSVATSAPQEITAHGTQLTAAKAALQHSTLHTLPHVTRRLEHKIKHSRYRRQLAFINTKKLAYDVLGSSSRRILADTIPDVLHASCVKSQHKEIHLEVQLDCTRSDTNWLNIPLQAARAVAETLNLRDGLGQLDLTMVNVFLPPLVNQTVSEVMFMDIFVKLAATTCEVNEAILAAHLQETPAALFASNAALVDLVNAVTLIAMDPAGLVKEAILLGGNKILDWSDNNSTDDNSSSASAVDSASQYDDTASFLGMLPGVRIKGMIAIGAITGSLFAVLMLLVTIQRWAKRRFQLQAEAVAAAAVRNAVQAHREEVAAQAGGEAAAVGSSSHAAAERVLGIGYN